MTAYAKQHEKYILQRLQDNNVDQQLIEYHRLRIQWLQHERLVHLLVFLFALVVTLIFFALGWVYQSSWMIGIFLIVLVLSIFYCIHYYFLENTVQRWYVLADEMDTVIRSKK